MGDDVIREVEEDPREGIIVTIEETAERVEVPAPCAGCLGEATKRLPPAGVSWIRFPYCDACVPPRAGAGKQPAERSQVSELGCLLAALGPLPHLLGWVAKDVGGQRGNAVKLLLSPGGTVRLGFKSPEYARLFVQANGAAMPPD